jgi:hypothetical protein
MILTGTRPDVICQCTESSGSPEKSGINRRPVFVSAQNLVRPSQSELTWRLLSKPAPAGSRAQGSKAAPQQALTKGTSFHWAGQSVNTFEFADLRCGTQEQC